MSQEIVNMISELRVLVESMIFGYIKDTNRHTATAGMQKFLQGLRREPEEFKTLSILKEHQTLLFEALEETLETLQVMVHNVNELVETLPEDLRESSRLDLSVIFEEQLKKYREQTA